jgi:hypothetical protein
VGEGDRRIIFFEKNDGRVMECERGSPRRSTVEHVITI